METPEELVRESERINLARLRLRMEADEVKLALMDWANRLGKEMVGILEKSGPDLPPQEAARFLRLLVLRSLLLNHDRVNSTAQGIERVREVLLRGGEEKGGEGGEAPQPLDVSL